MADAFTADRDKDFRTLCTLALINSKHAHYLWSLKRLVKEDLLREGAFFEFCLPMWNNAVAAGTQRADIESVDAVVLERYRRGLQLCMIRQLCC
jgi:hypothetical protein